MKLKRIVHLLFFSALLGGALYVWITWGLPLYNKYTTVTVKAEEQVVEEKGLRDREDVRKRIELAERRIVLEAERADEEKRHKEEMARLEKELEKVRGDELSLTSPLSQ